MYASNWPCFLCLPRIWTKKHLDQKFNFRNLQAEPVESCLKIQLRFDMNVVGSSLNYKFLLLLFQLFWITEDQLSYFIPAATWMIFCWNEASSTTKILVVSSIFLVNIKKVFWRLNPSIHTGSQFETKCDNFVLSQWPTGNLYLKSVYMQLFQCGYHCVRSGKIKGVDT